MAERQKATYESALRRATQHASSSGLFSRKLASLGETFHCYVPRLLRDMEFANLTTLSYVDITSHYAAGSWAIDDLNRLLERIADEAGMVTVETTPHSEAAETDGILTSVCESVDSVQSGQ